MEKPKNPFYGPIETQQQANSIIRIFFWFACVVPGLYLIKIFNQPDFSWSTLSPVEVLIGISGSLAITGYFCFKKLKKALYAYICAGAFLVFIVSRQLFLSQDQGNASSAQILSVLLLLFSLWITRRFLLAAALTSQNATKRQV